MAEFLGALGGIGFMITLVINVAFSLSDDDDYGWQETLLGLSPIIFLVMLVIGALMSL